MSAPEHNDWEFVDLTDEALDQPPTPPDLGHFLYRGQRHIVTGPPEAAKTLVLYAEILELVRAGFPVGILDFEMGARRAKMLLRELGADNDQLSRIRFVEPETAPKLPLEQLFAGCVIVLLDAAVGAYRASGLDDNSRVDAERFAETWIRPLWRAEIATVVVDHVTKDKETRGGFAIGSERKVGQADVHLGLTASAKLERGGKSVITVETHKDRSGFLRRPSCWFVELVSDPETHAVSVTWREPERMQHTDKGGARPTIKMDQVSRFLEQAGEPQSRNAIEQGVGGNREACRKAIDVLIAEGHCTVSEGPRRSILITLARPYSRAAEEEAREASERGRLLSDQAHFAHLAPTSPDFARGEVANRTTTTSPHFAQTPPYGGLAMGEVDGVRGDGQGEPDGTTSPKHDPMQIERLLEQYDELLGGD